MKKKWKKEGKIIRFSVFANGLTGGEWVGHLMKNGHLLSNEAIGVLLSPSFKRSEKGKEIKVSLILENKISLGLVQGEARDNNLYVPNPEIACLITDQFPAEEIKKMRIVEIVVMHNSIRERFYEKDVLLVIKDEKKVFSGILQNKRKNGEVYDARVSISPVLDSKNSVLYYVGIEQDITKEKEIDRAKTEFVSLASHQLRTPLSAINWFSEMLLAGDVGKLNPKQEEYLKEVYRGNQRMVELVNALLNVSRLELGTFAIEPEKANICQIADDLLREMEPLIKTKKIKFGLECDRTIPDMMLDKKLTNMVLQNLLSNAIKYTPEKGLVKLIITKNEKEIKIEVVDSGMGIPARQKDKIFSKLFRADNVRATDTEGTGLGLYLVKSIIDNLGGKIWFDSVENKGTTFSVTLPIKGMQEKKGTKSLT